MIKQTLLFLLMSVVFLFSGCSGEFATAKLGTPAMTNLNYDNKKGKMGDTDGPAYVVYSKKGYNKALIDVAISDISINNIRKSDKNWVNAYIFLGMDIYDDEGNWKNCLDTGFCYSGEDGGWHLFYNLYTTETKGARTWFESKKILKSSHDYRLTLDSSSEDGRAEVTIYDLTDNKKADSKKFEAAYALADGSNTAYLQNYALDYPDEVKCDTQGKYSNEDFVEITLYNTDENIYMDNVKVENAVIYDTNGEYDWTEEYTQNRSMWPDKNINIDYEVIKVWSESFDNNFTLSFDMNRQ